jgi:hypothetical protein
MIRLTRISLRASTAVGLWLLVAACTQQPAREVTVRNTQSSMPADLSGLWGRDYFRGDDVNRALEQWFRRLRRPAPNLRPAGLPELDNAGTVASPRDVNSILALARLADELTRPRYFTISQTQYEISVEREDDFDISCQFYDGAAEGAMNLYGQEICGWSGDIFISRLFLPDGLLVSHRYTVAPEGDELHVATTVSLRNTGMSFTLNRFYNRYEPSRSLFNCVDTLSMNRVCTTEEGSPLLE